MSEIYERPREACAPGCADGGGAGPCGGLAGEPCVLSEVASEAPAWRLTAWRKPKEPPFTPLGGPETGTTVSGSLFPTPASVSGQKSLSGSRVTAGKLSSKPSHGGRLRSDGGRKRRLGSQQKRDSHGRPAVGAHLLDSGWSSSGPTRVVSAHGSFAPSCWAEKVTEEVRVLPRPHAVGDGVAGPGLLCVGTAVG